MDLVVHAGVWREDDEREAAKREKGISVIIR